MNKQVKTLELSNIAIKVVERVENKISIDKKIKSKYMILTLIYRCIKLLFCMSFLID